MLRRWPWIAAAIALFVVALGYSVVGDEGAPEDEAAKREREVSKRAGSEVQSRPYDPANAIERTPDGARFVPGKEHLQSELGPAPPRPEVAAQADPAWSGLAAELFYPDAGTRFAKRQAVCKMQHLSHFGGKCTIDVRAVITRLSDDEGIVEYVEPDPEHEVTDPQCQAYNDCVLDAWVRRKLQLPSGTLRIYPIHSTETLVVKPPYPLTVGSVKADLRAAQEKLLELEGKTDPKSIYWRKVAKQRARWAEWLLSFQ